MIILQITAPILSMKGESTPDKGWQKKQAPKKVVKKEKFSDVLAKFMRY